MHWSLGKISQAGCAGNSKAWYFYRQVGIGRPIRFELENSGLLYSSCSHFCNKTIIQAAERHGTTWWSTSLATSTGRAIAHSLSVEHGGLLWFLAQQYQLSSWQHLLYLQLAQGVRLFLVAMLFNAMVYSTCNHLHRKCDCTQYLSGRRPTHFSGHPLSVGCTSALWR